MKKTVFAALTLACALLTGCSGTAQPNDSGAVYPQSAADESTVQPLDSEPTAQSSDDESSSEQSPDSDPTVEKRPGHESHELTFPAHDFGRTEHNTRMLDVTPFKLTVDLPDEWDINIPQSKDEYEGGGLASVDIMLNGEKIGSIDYDIYDSNDIDESDENAYRMIYNQIMLGNVISWNCDYKEVSTIDNTVTSTCRIMIKDVPADEYAHGILARNKSLGVYVKIAINDAAMPADTIEYIAKTIELK